MNVPNFWQLTMPFWTFLNAEFYDIISWSVPAFFIMCAYFIFRMLLEKKPTLLRKHTIPAPWSKPPAPQPKKLNSDETVRGYQPSTNLEKGLPPKKL